MFFVVNVIILFFFVLAFGKEFARNYTIQREINELQAQADTLAARNLEVAELAQAIQTESFIEREARLKLGLSKPGEQVVVVDEGGVGQAMDAGVTAVEQAQALMAAAASEEGETYTDVANQTKWWYYFFDKPKFEAIKIYGTSSASER